MVEPLRNAVIVAFKASNLTQDQLAKRALTSQSNVSDLMNRKRQGSYRSWLLLAFAIGVDLNDIAALTVSQNQQESAFKDF